MRYRITLAYDGTDYFGWQMQASHPTIQSILTMALERIEGRRIVTHAAGRTDAGVHAEGQVVSFDLDREWDGIELRRALNGNLPQDIRVIDAATADDDFHARVYAVGKTYSYRINTGEVSNPFLRRYVWDFRHKLDLEKLQVDLNCLCGTHDFIVFTVADSETKTSVRTIREARLENEGELLTIYFSGTGFLRYQVRTMIAALVELNRGRLKAGSVEELISSGDRSLVGAPAPAKGLTLMKVEY